MLATKPIFAHEHYWAECYGTSPFLPMTRAEMDALGWDSCDVIIVKGDACVNTQEAACASKSGEAPKLQPGAESLLQPVLRFVPDARRNRDKTVIRCSRKLKRSASRYRDSPASFPTWVGRPQTCTSWPGRAASSRRRAGSRAASSPGICSNLNTDHSALTGLYRKARAVPGVKKVLIASGPRYDLAVEDPEHVKEVVTHHLGGYLKIAPEHTEQGPLDKMMKPGIGSYDRFKALFEKFSKKAGEEQYLIPYFIAAHPDTTDLDMVNLALWLKTNRTAPRRKSTREANEKRKLRSKVLTQHTGLPPRKQS